MIKIYYPSYPFKIREPEKKKEEIWDELRKQWVRLTPEEWVRQNFIQYLLQIKNYPASYIAVERRMKLGELNKIPPELRNQLESDIEFVQQVSGLPVLIKGVMSPELATMAS